MSLVNEEGPLLSQATTYLENYFLAEQATRAEVHVPNKAGGRGRRKGVEEDPPRGTKPSRPSSAQGSRHPSSTICPLGRVGYLLRRPKTHA